MTCVTGGVQLHVQHPLGDDAALARPRETRILNGMLQIKQHAWCVAGIALVHQHRTTAQEIAVPFQGEIEHGVKQADDPDKQKLREVGLGALSATSQRRYARIAAGPARRHRSSDLDCVWAQGRG